MKVVAIWNKDTAFEIIMGRASGITTTEAIEKIAELKKHNPRKAEFFIVGEEVDVPKLAKQRLERIEKKLEKFKKKG